jgi:prevent-host-death family protein
MITVNMHEAKTNLSQLVQAVEERSETVLLCRNGRPVAKLIPNDPLSVDHFHRNPRLAGELLEDPTAPLPADAWPDPKP